MSGQDKTRTLDHWLMRLEAPSRLREDGRIQDGKTEQAIEKVRRARAAASEELNRLRREASVASEETRQLERNLEELRKKLAAAEARERQVVDRAKKALASQDDHEAELKRVELELAARRREREEEIAGVAVRISAALNEYLATMAASAPEFLARMEQEKGTVRAVERAKEENARVRELAAEREEWLAIKGTTALASVRRDAEAKAGQLARELEGMVPGILTAGKGTEWLEPLYHATAAGTMTLYLPVNPAGWREFQTGADTPRACWAARVVFGLARHYGNPVFAVNGDQVTATVDGDVARQVSDQIPLSGEEMAMLLTPLPEKVREVLS